MSIQRKFLTTRLDGVKLYRIFSDEEKNIRQNPTNIIYKEVIDVENAPYTYSEIEPEPKEHDDAN